MNEKKLQPLPKNILIVEDDDDIGNFITIAITGETSHIVTLVKDGFQALQYVKTKKPDLFILDYHLPDMNGIQLYEHFCTRQELQDVPVLMISANVPEHEVRKRHLTLVRKPFELDALLEAVEDMIRKPVEIAHYHQLDTMRWA